MTDAKSPNIFQYSNYRSYLKDLYLHLKKEKKAVTYRWLSKKGGFSSPNFLKLVIDGERNLSNDSIPKAALAFGLSRDEASFFKILVHFTQAKKPQDQELYGRKLANHKRVTKVLPLKGDQFNYYSNSLNILIRELITLEYPPTNIPEIQVKLLGKYKDQEIKESLELLERLKLIRKNDLAPGWKATSNSVWSGDEVFSQAVTSYHQHMISEGAESIQKVKSEERDISSVTVGISIENFSKIKKMIQTFRQEIIQMSDDDSSREMIYQMNVQFFPLTKSGRDNP